MGVTVGGAVDVDTSNVATRVWAKVTVNDVRVGMAVQITSKHVWAAMFEQSVYLL